MQATRAFYPYQLNLNLYWRNLLDVRNKLAIILTLRQPKNAISTLTFFQRFRRLRCSIQRPSRDNINSFYIRNHTVLLYPACTYIKQRNLKNKVCKLVESVRFGEQKTLMGYILEVFGVDVRLLNVEN
ncbi:unnamed protein product [Trichobilharzia szidati]|nr:unnamed protein product [Trichobilharzia szidati]